MSYITEDGRTMWIGAKPDADHKYLECEKCGSKKIRMVCHVDGREFYGTGYNCENGHHIEARYKRNRGLWGQEG